MHDSTANVCHVTIWNEFKHEREKDEVKRIYPDGIHQVIKAGIEEKLAGGVRVQCATLDEPEHGLTDEVLANTQVMLWWGHAAHDQVSDEVVAKVYRRVLEGMGLIVLHSGHGSKIFRKLMGTECMLRWREANEIERLWIVAPGHPILAGIDGDYIELPSTEMYGEHFDIPTPEELLLISWFEGGEVFRSGCTFRRGAGKIFYFRPGHETYPIYYNSDVKTIIANAVTWARPQHNNFQPEGRHIPQPLNPIRSKD